MDFSVWKILLVLNKNLQIWYEIVQYMLWDLYGVMWVKSLNQDHSDHGASKHSSVPFPLMNHNVNDRKSLILILITPKERTW